MLPIWKESPFIRILMPFLLGIFCYVYFAPGGVWFAGATFALSMAGLLCFGYSADYFKFAYAYLKGLLLHLLIAAAAYLICVFHHSPNSAFWYKHHCDSLQYVLVRVYSEPEIKPKTMKAVVEVLQCNSEKQTVSTQGLALLYFQKSEKSFHIEQGQHLLIKNKFTPIPNSLNPGGFDYAAWCKTKNIFESAFLRSGDWEFTAKHSDNFLSWFASGNRNTRKILKRFVPDTHTIGIAEALLLGYRADIDRDVWQAYTDTGIVHIIAISGMHMAMVYASVRFLLLLFPFFKRRKAIALLLAIAFMWLFACITGLPASVCRAAVMFTFIGWGEAQERKMNIYNNLAASAFCMLCFNPMLIKDIGFQLSYAAVLSLVVFYTPVYRLFYFSNRAADFFWKLATATLAAQILTFPLCIYYFHQFPLLFLLTNLIAVPLTTLILYLEIVLVFVSFFSPLATLLGRAISYLISLVNSTVQVLSGLNFAVWSQINISFLQMLMLYAIVVFMATAFFYRNMRCWIFSLIALLIFWASLLVNRFEIYRQQKIIVYHIPGKSCLEFIKQHGYENADGDTIIKNSNHEAYVLKPAHIFFNVKKSSESMAIRRKQQGVELFSFEGKEIVRLEHHHFECKRPIEADILILSKGCMPDKVWIERNFRTPILILDSSIPSWKADQLKEQLKGLNARVYVVEEEGAFVWDLS